MQALRLLERALGWVERAALVVLVTGMVSLSFAQVILRMFGKGLLWGDTLARHMVIWAGFLGAAVATAEGKHFALDTFAESLKGRARAAVHALAGLSALALTCWLAAASWSFCVLMRETGEVLFHVGGIAVPTWSYSLVYPGGFALLAVHILLRLGLSIPGAQAGEP